MSMRWARGLLVVLGIACAGCGGEEPPGGPGGGPTVALARALGEPTVTVTVDLAGYAGSINIGAFPAAGQGTVYAVPLPSGQHDITTPLAFDETSGSNKIGTLTVDAVAGTISLDSTAHFQPVAPTDRVLHLKTIVFPYDPGDTAYFPVALIGVGWFSGNGGIFPVRVLDNHRYWMYMGSTANRDGTSGGFSPAPDIILRNGCAEIVPGALTERSFAVRNCRLSPRLTILTVSSSVDIPLALNGLFTLPQGRPVKVIRERLYQLGGPSSVDLETGLGYFSSTYDLFVGSEGGPDIVRFVPESKAARLFSTHNRMIEAEQVTRLTFDARGSTTDLELADGYPIHSTDLVKGRRYVVKAIRSWDPDDLVSQNFIAGRFGGEPGLIIGDDGRMTVTPAVSKHFEVYAWPPRLVAKVGTVRFGSGGIKEKLRVNATTLTGASSHCGTKVLLGRIHQLALMSPSGVPVANGGFTMDMDGHCSPTTVTFPQGTVTLDCSR
jgi:hypothetical protein